MGRVIHLWQAYGEPRKTQSLPKGTPSEDLTRDQLAHRVNMRFTHSEPECNLKREKGESHGSVTVTSSDIPVIQVIDTATYGFIRPGS